MSKHSLTIRFIEPKFSENNRPMSTSSFDTIAYRLSEILLRLNAGEALEIKKLADDFAVNERTIRRDLNERFSFLGLEKKGSRYTLPRYKLGTYSQQDVQRIASLAGLQGMSPRLSSDFLGDLLDNSLRGALLVHGTRAEDISGKEHELAQLRVGIQDSRIVQFEYCKPDDTRKMVSVNPYKLALSDGSWYLQATDQGKVKSYAVSRIDRLLVTSDSFSPDASVHEYLKSEDTIWLNQEKAKVVLKVAPPAASYFQRRQLIGSQKIEMTLEDGEILVSGLIAHPNQILPVVRYWIPYIRVISPDGLQAELDAQLKAYLGVPG
ncbi:YafY family protein [Diaphorobacter sp. HDW4B]|uniref:helix-turn-helix transcriptional regulator n=1 Tax=Diaphorobacter sp. HDW4B TaxID=2714925 RepID=UPI001F0DE99C|nr:WYL domain-containing protein [Diaphorobacter sp. HDW4B]